MEKENQRNFKINFKCHIIKNIGSNCYVVENKGNFLLIDTGYSKKRKILLRELTKIGCDPNNIKLIVHTHGDYDHIGNSEYLRKKYGIPLALHKNEVQMVKTGDMFANRANISPILKILTKLLIPFFRIKPKKKEFFTPDYILSDNEDIGKYGFEAKIIHIPGHSKGSIGILLPNNNFFCGDLLWNNKKPQKFSLIDNKEDFEESILKLSKLDIAKVYPGHGNPFYMNEFLDL